MTVMDLIDQFCPTRADADVSVVRLDSSADHTFNVRPSMRCCLVGDDEL